MAFLRSVEYMAICDKCGATIIDYSYARNIPAFKKAHKDELSGRTKGGQLLCDDCLQGGTVEPPTWTPEIVRNATAVNIFEYMDNQTKD